MSLWLALVGIVLNRAFNDFSTVRRLAWRDQYVCLWVCVETAFHQTPAEHFARIFLNAKSTIGRGAADGALRAPYGRPWNYLSMNFKVERWHTNAAHIYQGPNMAKNDSHSFLAHSYHIKLCSD